MRVTTNGIGRLSCGQRVEDGPDGVVICGRRSVDADSDHGQCHLLGDEGEVAMLQRKEELRFGESVRFRGSRCEASHSQQNRSRLQLKRGSNRESFCDFAHRILEII